jgi:hypothetical protein
MRNIYLLGLLLAGLAMIPGAVLAMGSTSPYIEMAAHYEAIRLVLLEDSIEGMADHAGAIEDQVKGLLEEFDAATSSVPEKEVATLKPVLEEIQAAASKLTGTDGLDSAREHFFSLTKPLVRFRKLSGDQTTIVAYCPMTQKAWIQPEGEIGNPYMGQQMPKCGEVVGE